MVVTPRIQSMIVPGAEADAIHAAAIADGMVPITQAAVALAREGVISLAEAWRVRAD
jgi:type IV pilus assembly protein PilB